MTERVEIFPTPYILFSSGAEHPFSIRIWRRSYEESVFLVAKTLQDAEQESARLGIRVTLWRDGEDGELRALKPLDRWLQPLAEPVRTKIHERDVLAHDKARDSDRDL